MAKLPLGVFGDASNSFHNASAFDYKPGWNELYNTGATAPVQAAVAGSVAIWPVWLSSVACSAAAIANRFAIAVALIQQWPQSLMLLMFLWGKLKKRRPSTHARDQSGQTIAPEHTTIDFKSLQSSRKLCQQSGR